MTVISLGHAARLSRPGIATITNPVEVGKFSRGKRKLICPPVLREQVGPYFGTSRPQEFASGFVDFLLGRSPRDPR
jgi:hypothetical protein